MKGVNFSGSRCWVVSVVLLALVALNYVFVMGWLLPEPDFGFAKLEKSEEHLYQISGYISALVASSDNILSTLMTLQIGLFVFVGFMIQKFYKHENCIPVAEGMFCFLFLVSSFISIYFAYSARIQVFELVNATRIEFKELRPFIGWHAFFLSASGIFTACFATLAFMGSSTPRTADEPEPKPKPMPMPVPVPDSELMTEGDVKRPDYQNPPLSRSRSGAGDNGGDC